MTNQDDISSFISDEKIPDSFPEEFPGITRFANAEASASLQFDSGDIALVNSLARHFQVGATKNLLDELIDRHAEAYLSAYPDIKEFSAFEKSGTYNYYIGMVWTSDNEKPDTQQLRIRGSESLAKNKLVELDLSAVTTSQSFFPGQIVAFKAEPFIRRQMTVHSFIDPIKIAPVPKKIDTDDKINLIIASGPFMKPEKEDWEMFDALIENIKECKATHAILIGPFVDMENKAICARYDEFWKLVFDKLIEGLHTHSCHVYLVPSSRDLLPASMSSCYFYPTPEFELKYDLKQGFKPACKIRAVGDPSQIDLGGIYVDVTSAEVLFHFNLCTAFNIRDSTSPFIAMYKNILSHGIYPIYPSHPDMAVDYPKLRPHIQLDRLGPHIVVVPTKFNTSVTNVEGRVFVSIHKCSVKRHIVLIEIPKIESTEEEPCNSVASSDYTHRLIDLTSSSSSSAEAGLKEPTSELQVDNEMAAGSQVSQ